MRGCGVSAATYPLRRTAQLERQLKYNGREILLQSFSSGDGWLRTRISQQFRISCRLRRPKR